jgi:NTP pyrophosphatase (non-canonical NTP hydrolase)
MESADWDKLIEERNAWIAHNFPGPDMPNTMLGVIEELGELTHSWLKRDQGIRGTTEQHNEDMKDAVGDLTVYLLGCMKHYEVKPDYECNYRVERDVPRLLFQLSDAVGSLAMRNSPQWYVSRICYLLSWICHIEGWDYDSIVKDTWAGVRERDWIKYPDTGKPGLDGPDDLSDLPEIP